MLHSETTLQFRPFLLLEMRNLCIENDRINRHYEQALEWC